MYCFYAVGIYGLEIIYHPFSCVGYHHANAMNLFQTSTCLLIVFQNASKLELVSEYFVRIQACDYIVTSSILRILSRTKLT
jgi:hypothetical protein